MQDIFMPFEKEAQKDYINPTLKTYTFAKQIQKNSYTCKAGTLTATR